MQNKYKAMFIIVLAIIVVTISITTSVMAGCTMHTDHCELEECSLCRIINMSINLVKTIELINICVFIIVANIYLVQLIIKNIQKEIHSTLVELKVVQNR